MAAYDGIHTIYSWHVKRGYTLYSLCSKYASSIDYLHLLFFDSTETKANNIKTKRKEESKIQTHKRLVRRVSEFQRELHETPAVLILICKDRVLSNLSV